MAHNGSRCHCRQRTHFIYFRFTCLVIRSSFYTVHLTLFSFYHTAYHKSVILFKIKKKYFSSIGCISVSQINCFLFFVYSLLVYSSVEIMPIYQNTERVLLSALLVCFHRFKSCDQYCVCVVLNYCMINLNLPAKCYLFRHVDDFDFFYSFYS